MIFVLDRLTINFKYLEWHCAVIVFGVMEDNTEAACNPAEILNLPPIQY